MNTGVPKEVPVKNLSDSQVEAVERFYEEYVSDIGSYAAAVLSGHNPAPSSTHVPDAGVSGNRYVDAVEIYGETIPFDGAYETSGKHTYYSGIHASGYRLTAEYHDASGGGYHRLRVRKEEDL